MISVGQLSVKALFVFFAIVVLLRHLPLSDVHPVSISIEEASD